MIKLGQKQRITLGYIRFLRDIDRAMRQVDEERYDSITIRQLCSRFASMIQHFWYENYTTYLQSDKSQELVPVMHWGVPSAPPPGTDGPSASEFIANKLLCYSHCAVIPDWASDVLEFLSFGTPGTYHDVFRNLKSSVNHLVALEEYAKEGSVLVFPGYDYCRQRWPDEYKEFEVKSKSLAAQHGSFNKILRELRVPRPHAQLYINVLQESLFIRDQLGFIPAVSAAGYFETGGEYFRVGGAGTKLGHWAENYQYAADAAPELVAEIRRWGNQALFLEFLPQLSEKFDLLDGSRQNLERIAYYVKERKNERAKERGLRRRIKEYWNIAVSAASIIFSPLSVVSIAQSIRSLREQRREPERGERWAADWSCLIRL